MAGILKPVQSKQAIITISELTDVVFTSMKGGKIAREKIKFNDGQTGIERQFVGFSSFENILVSKPFEPNKDGVIISWCKTQSNSPTAFNLAIQPVKNDLAGSVLEGASQILYSNCSLGDYSWPEWDRSSSSLAMITLEIIFNELPSYG